MKLYEIKQDFLRLAEMDLDEQTMQDTLESLQFELEEKADNIACLIKQVEAEAEAIKTEAKNLTDRAKAKETKVERLTQYLLDTLKAVGTDKIETTRNILQVKKNPVSVVLDEGFNHPGFITTKLTTVPDKSLIKEWLQQGKELDGARLEQRERLVIK